MLRHLVHIVTKIEYPKIRFIRSELGKPLLVFFFSIIKDSPSSLSLSLAQENNVNVCFDFNLSHHGDWIILGSDPIHSIGVDLMKLEVPSGL